MSDTTPIPSLQSSPPPPEPQQGALEAWVTRAFMGPNGIRAGWRLLIFLAIVVGLILGVAVLSLAVSHGKAPQQAITPETALFGEGIFFVFVVFATLVMAKMEHRKFGDYGLPFHNVFRGRFWQGAAVGFAAISALLFFMREIGVFQFGAVGLHGVAIYKYAALWGVAFLFVGLFEEFGFRGYALFTLTTGMTFWPAAILASICFGLLHRGNSGESWVGVLTAGLVGLLFCLLLRRTGDLWMPVGFHAAWDWGESYFYGVPDSGNVTPGHLFNARFSGPAWLTGGTVGPEGSWLCVALLVILWVIFALWLREAKYPDPAALSLRKKAEEEMPSLFPASS